MLEVEFTRCDLPNWSTKRIDKAFDTLDISFGEVKLIESIENYPEPSFLKFKVKDFIPDAILLKGEKIANEITNWFDVPFEKLLDLIKTAEPSDKKEIADWMHEVTAVNILTRFVVENYNQSNESYISYSIDDAFIPGVGIGRLHFISRPASTIERLGYVSLVLPDGSIENITYNKAKTIIKSKLLAFVGSRVYQGYAKQWTGFIVKWNKLASTITGKVRNLICKYYGIVNAVCPQFFLQIPRKASKMIKIKARFWSRTNQRIEINWRDPRNYERVIYRDFIDVPAGLSELTASFGAYPHVPPLVCHLQPNKSDYTVESYYVEVS